jgi:hypothetical protein
MLEDGIPVVNIDSDFSEVPPQSGSCDCGCDCEDDVVEFGYVEVETPELPDEDKNNVVEF